jgi:hypothetical protein
MTRFARFAAVLVLAQIGLAQASQAVEPIFPPGRDTTFVDGPLDDEGYVDYAEALNLHYGRGITPENNAFVPLWKTIGPASVPPELRAKYFQRLGIDVPPEKENYFVTFEAFLKTREWDPETGEAPKDQLMSVFSRPWNADEFPHVAAWLKANEGPLAAIDDAVKRPEYFRPVVVPETTDGRAGLIEAPVAGLFELFDISRAFAARALLRTAEGKHAEAWNDLLRCHRVGRLAARGPFLIDLLVGCSIDNLAAATDVRYLALKKWTAESAAAHVADLNRLPAMPPLAEKFNRAERFQYLDLVGRIRQGKLDSVERFVGETHMDNADVLRRMTATIDYGPALRSGNRWFDRLERAARMQVRSERRDEFLRLNVEIKKLIPTGSWSRAGFWLGLTAGTPATRGERIGDVVAALVLPTLPSTDQIESRSVQQMRNVNVALALAAFRADEGRYPDKLAELVPKHLAEVPDDLFADAPPVYRRAEGGYLLYSIGPDGVDDQGRNQYEDSQRDYGRDDIAIRMSIPQSTGTKE